MNERMKVAIVGNYPREVSQLHDVLDRPFFHVHPLGTNERINIQTTDGFNHVSIVEDHGTLYIILNGLQK